MSRWRAFLVVACLQAASGGVAARERGPLTVTKVDDPTLRLEGRVGLGDAERVIPALSGRETRLLAVGGEEAVDAIDGKRYLLQLPAP